MTTTQWLAAWADATADLTIVAGLGLALITGASFVRLTIRILKSAMHT